jgi:hypothetical protein
MIVGVCTDVSNCGAVPHDTNIALKAQQCKCILGDTPKHERRTLQLTGVTSKRRSAFPCRQRCADVAVAVTHRLTLGSATASTGSAWRSRCSWRPSCKSHTAALQSLLPVAMMCCSVAKQFTWAVWPGRLADSRSLPLRHLAAAALHSVG